MEKVGMLDQHNPASNALECPTIASTILCSNQPNIRLLAVPHPGDLGMSHLLLQLENTKHERLGGGRATRHVNVNRHNPVATPRNTVAVVVVTTAVRARTHGDDPAWVGHLIVDLAQSWRHLVRERAGDDHDIGLTGRGAENDSHAILVVAWCGEMHHFNGAAGETEGHGPEGALACPVGDLVEGCAVTLSVCYFPLDPSFASSLTYSAYCMTPCLPSWLGNGTSL